MLQLESVLKKIAVLEPVCKRLTYISKNMIWAVASSFSINLTHILESWLWKLISFMYLNTLVTRSLPDDCSAMDLAEQFSCLAKPDCFGWTREGRVLSNAVYLHLASSLLVPKWSKNPLFPRVWFWHALKVCAVSWRWAQGTSKWEPQLRNPVLWFCPSSKPWSYSCHCSGLW